MRYKLFFDSIEIGEVIETDTHTPYSFGKLYLSIKFMTRSDSISKRLKNYIMSELRMAIQKMKKSDNIEAYEKVKKEQENFDDLKKIDKWHLKNESGLRIYIMSPGFNQKKEIVWRLHPDKMSSF